MTEGTLQPEPTEPTEPTQSTQSTPQAEPTRARDLAQIVYILQTVGLFIGVSWIAGAVVNHLKRDEARGTWVESHFDWQMRSFWIWLGGAILVWALKAKLALLVATVVSIWLIVRVVKGWLALRDRRAAPDAWI
ncbi:MAG: hypothetical protein WCA12_16530 [Burkholderiales bacterium]